MSERKQKVACDYCGASYVVLFSFDNNDKPQFCCFCGEFNDAKQEVEEEEDPDFYNDEESEQY